MPMTASSPRLYYEVRGAGDPLLVITGFAASSAVLAPMAELYGTRLRCITFDYPGSGRSSKRSVPFSTAQLAASAIALLDELGIESAHVAGLSLGGAVAQELALRFPDRVRGLILMATSTSGPLSAPPDPLALAALTARVLEGSLRRGRLWLGPALFSPGFLQAEPDRADALARPLTAHFAPPWSIAGQVWAAGLHDRGLDLGRIRAPTLVLHGEDDVLVRVANARLLAEGIPDAELHVFPDAGHGFEFERLEETFSIVVDWLERRQPAAGEPRSAAARREEQLTRELAAPAGALRLGRSWAVLAARALRQASATSSR
jgi:pimeloyl-ACP methyl ester carboxylesterase